MSDRSDGSIASRDDQIQAKEAAIKRAREILGEHCEAYVLTVEYEIEEEEVEFTRTHLYWKGGFNNALGLVRRASLRLDYESNDSDFGSDERSDGGDEWKERV